MNDDTFDLRKYPRVRIQGVVSVSRTEPPDLSGEAVDLSMGGVRFRCPAFDVGAGQHLQVTIDLEGKELCLLAKVIRVIELDAFAHELAVSFVSLDAATQERLERYVENSPEF